MGIKCYNNGHSRAFNLDVMLCAKDMPATRFLFYAATHIPLRKPISPTTAMLHIVF